MLHAFVRHAVINNHTYESFSKNNTSERLKQRHLFCLPVFFLSRTCFMPFFRFFFDFFLEIIVFRLICFPEQTKCNSDTHELLRLCFYFISTG